MQRVLAPPPLIFAAAVALGLGVGRLWPLSPSAAWVGWGIGGPLAALGLAVAAAAAVRFRAAGTSFEPGRPAAALVTTGVFRLTRNPIYCGMALICIGVALLAGDPWVLLTLACALVLVHHGVVLREEAMLTRQFGDEYVHYQQRVPRWVRMTGGLAKRP